MMPAVYMLIEFFKIVMCMQLKIAKDVFSLCANNNKMISGSKKTSILGF